MLERIRGLFDRMEHIRLSFFSVVILSFTAIYLRGCIEMFANSANAGYATSFTDAFIHFPFWYGSVFAVIILIIHLFTKHDVWRITKVVAFATFLVLLPPIIDILVYGPGGHVYAYIGHNYSVLLFYFANFLTQTTALGIGIKIEIYVALALVGLYVFTRRTRARLRGAFAAMFCTYAAIFFFLSAPVHVLMLYNLFAQSYDYIGPGAIIEEYSGSPERHVLTSSQTVVVTHTYGSPIPTTEEREHYTSTALGTAFVISFVLLIALLYRLADANKSRALFGNLRLTRLAHYLLLFSIGAALGFQHIGPLPHALSLFDVLTLAAAALGLVFAWLFSVWENDEADKKIDRISNSSRPLAAGTHTPAEWKTLTILFFLLSLCFAWLSGWYPFVVTLVFILVYRVYSMPPLRLKWVIGLSSVFIGVNAALVTLLGFFAVAGTTHFDYVPFSELFGIFIIFLLAENVKNIKDIEGDRAEGILTLPVLLGERYAKPVVGLLAALAALLLPVFLGQTGPAFVLAATFAILLFLLITRKHYTELPVFLTYFAYVGALGALMLFS